MDLSGSWGYIEEIARNRLANNKTSRHVYDYGESIELIGVAGELIVRRFLGIPEKLHEHFDKGVDINYFGMRIDVKATILTPNANYRYLQWPEWKKVKADYIVMACIDPLVKIGTVIGYTTKAGVMEAPVNRGRPTACREIPFGELRPAWELVVEATRRRAKQAINQGQFPTLETRNRNRGGSSTPMLSKP